MATICLALYPLVYVGKYILSRIAGDYIDVPECLCIINMPTISIKHKLGQTAHEIWPEIN